MAFKFTLADQYAFLSLEKFVYGDDDGHFSRYWVDEISQCKNHAIHDPADHCGDHQKAEQAGHEQASGSELTIDIIGEWPSLTTNMFTATLQESPMRGCDTRSVLPGFLLANVTFQTALE